MHHDVRALAEHDGTLYAMTKYGVSVLSLDGSAQSHHSLPQGVVLHDAFLAESGGAPYGVVMGTSIGFAVAPLLADGRLPPSERGRGACPKPSTPWRRWAVRT